MHCISPVCEGGLSPLARAFRLTIRFAKTGGGDARRDVPLFLVDDRDGRIVTKIEREDELRRVLEAMANDDPGMPDYLCLVETASNHGSFFGTDTSVKIRTLQ